MSRLTIREVEELQAQTLDALEPVRLKGRIADVYLQFANSENALRAYLLMERSIRDGSLADAEAEAIKLWVSQQTGCEFCLSVHSYKATQAGLTQTQQASIRRTGVCGIPRIDALLKVAAAIFHSPGSISEALLNEARDAGLSDETLVDLCMAISTIFFTNITNHINDSRSGLPPAPVLE